MPLVQLVCVCKTKRKRERENSFTTRYFFHRKRDSRHAAFFAAFALFNSISSKLAIWFRRSLNHNSVKLCLATRRSFQLFFCLKKFRFWKVFNSFNKFLDFFAVLRWWIFNWISHWLSTSASLLDFEHSLNHRLQRKLAFCVLSILPSKLHSILQHSF